MNALPWLRWLRQKVYTIHHGVVGLFPMLVGPSLQRACDSCRPGVGQASGHDQNAGVCLYPSVEIQGCRQEVIPVPRHEYMPAPSGEAKLLVVGNTEPAKFMNALHVQADASRNSSYLVRQILVQQEAHSLFAPRRPHEWELPVYAVECPALLKLQPLIYLLGVKLIVPECGP